MPSLATFEPSRDALQRRVEKVSAARYANGAELWRRPGVVAVIVVVLAAYALLPAVPGADLLTTAPLWASVIAMGGQAVWLVWCAVAIRAGVDSSHYRRIRVVDTTWWCLSSCVLIALSDSASSLYWLNLVTFIAFMLPNVVRHGFYRGVLSVGLAGLVVSFAWRGDVASTVLCLIVGACLLFVQRLSTRLALEAHTHQARAELVVEAVAAQQAAQERERIARDLHDRVASDLTEVLWTASSMDDEEAQRLVGVLQGCMMSLREVVAGARAEPIAAQLLARRVALGVEALGDAAGQEVSVKVDVAHGDAEVPPEVAVTVLRAAQELVRNALTHASASRVSVTIRLAATAVLVVEDDGAGLSGGVEGDGLRNLRARVEEVGGALHIDDDHGTRVTVGVPCDPSGASASV